MPIIDLESNISIKELLENCGNGARDVNPIACFQRFALNTSLTLGYGKRLHEKFDKELLQEVFHVERIISNLRSTSNNYQDYIPLFRLWPSRNLEATHYRERRDRYMSFLLNRLKAQIANGTDKPCITGNILKDPEAKLNEGKSPEYAYEGRVLRFTSRTQINLS
jgi:phenylacetate 2-hydroxylase